MGKIETKIKTDIRVAIKVKSIQLALQKAESHHFYEESIFRVDRAPGMHSPATAHASFLVTLMTLISGEQREGDSPACLSSCQL